MAAPYQDRHQNDEDGPRSDERPFSDVGHEEGGAGGPYAVTFRVEGMDAAPQGSKRHVGRGVMIESSRNVKPWRFLVTQSALAAGVPLLRGPVRLSVVFIFSRPAGHFRKNGSLKPSAPLHHSIRPDLSKLLRSTEDALTSVAYEDDSRIVGCAIEKRYAIGDERPGALVTVIPL
jgi:crossover junction endodeoxyribonuclease RusA